MKTIIRSLLFASFIGACSTLAPGIIAMGETSAVVVRQPQAAQEIAATEAALFNCPMLAIRKRTASAQEVLR